MKKFLGEGKPYYLPKRRISIAKAVETIVAAGGVPVLAHPMQYHYPEPELIELIETAKALGIRALEAYYSGVLRRTDRVAAARCGEIRHGRFRRQRLPRYTQNAHLHGHGLRQSRDTVFGP